MPNYKLDRSAQHWITQDKPFSKLDKIFMAAGIALAYCFVFFAVAGV